MAQGFRLPKIVEIARVEGRVTVDDLAARFGVTAQTIRRDLADLDDAGKLERVHGGAILRSGTVNIGYQERAALNAEAKQSIARACAAEIPEGASVFLAIGTTTEAVARELRRHGAAFLLQHHQPAVERVRERVVRARPRYWSLFNRRDQAFSDADFRDLQVLFNLAWFGAAARVEYPLIAAMEAKGRDFREALHACYQADL